MKILALETSAKACSAALCDGERLLAQSFQNCGLTHSVTLMPMVEELLKNCGETLDGVELVAVAAGPGSFTGVRIGVAAAKGLAWPGDKPCAAVSTLEAMAWTAAHVGGGICPVMDARRGQVYNARFRGEWGRPVRLTSDRAVSLDELAAELEQEGAPQFLVGDGAEMCYNALRERGLDVRLAPEHLRWQTAWGVARAALELAGAEETVNGAALKPAYLRLSQAERERLARLQEENAKQTEGSKSDV